MKICRLKKLSEQKITVYEGSDCVEGCYRNAVLTDMSDNEDLEIVLSGSDAFIPLIERQRVLVDLRVSSGRCANDGKWYHDYYVMSIHPIEENAKIEYVKDWTTRLV